MKTLPTIAAAAIALTLVLSPMVVSAAGSITFTSPASNSSFKGTASYTITGTISPAPSQADQVGITVKNPSGQIVDVASVSENAGSFTYSTATGGTAAWITGTYTITATDAFGATGTTTFSYTGTTGGSYNLQGNITYIEQQLKDMNNTLNALAAQDTSETASIAALQQSVGSISSALQTLTNNVATLQTNVGTLQTDVTNMQGQLTTISSNIATLNTAVQNAQAAAVAAQTAAQNANNSVSSTQTYVLVVAVLAAITLVLELAILVRKLS